MLNSMLLLSGPGLFLSGTEKEYIS
jgi:hypothetical protein